MEKFQLDWNDFTNTLLSHWQFSFTVNELKEEFRLSDAAVNQGLYRLLRKKKIKKIREGFYAVLPPSCRQFGELPMYSYIHHLMQSLGKPYYVGLLTAASLHGAAHQAPAAEYVFAQYPAPRSIVNRQMPLYFISKKELIAEGIAQKKGEAGYFNVSSPELTAFDLLDQIRRFGLDHITTVLQELHEAMKISALKKMAACNTISANIQRLGYILENFTEGQHLTGCLEKILAKRATFPVPLSPLKANRGKIDKKWRIIVNTEIAPDL
ncbi:MAG: type IV toxin-antitoxin system AbiEi family antitoxin [Prevotellaceae bacterium]|jgi:predicted transcriptional regulator of viral defense system|nr:type IV toxin-antitoxin system AbiEi family antitoxin [Prevotellaceae bacterium]